MRVNKVYLVALGTLLAATLVVLLMKLSKASPIVTAIGILLVAVLGLFMLTRQMSISEKAAARGAKKRRKKLLPMFYKKKKKKRGPSK
jgi:high-affinity Fe2+/Pb2+ permease